MRRVLLFAAFLLLLGLTTATAASFQVRTGEISSFTQVVDIEAPATKYYLVMKDGTDRLSPNEEDLTTADPFEEELFPGEFREWNTGALAGDVPLVGNDVDLQIYLVGSNGDLKATIYDCAIGAPSGDADCPALAFSTAAALPNGVNVLQLSSPSGDVTAGNQLRLRIENASPAGGGSFKIQWGKAQPGRDSNILISALLSP